MKRNTKIAVSILTVVAIASGTAAIARGSHGNMGERIVNRISDRLELNEQQTEALGKLQIEIRETAQLVRGNSANTAQNLTELVKADTFDQGAALEMITARTTAMQTQAPDLVAAAASFLDGLDAEQKEELGDMMQRIGKHGRGHNK